MVQPARDAHGVVRLTGHHEAACCEHTTYHAGAGLVHVREDGVVRGPETVVQEVGQIPRSPPGLLDHAHVAEAVDGRQVLVCRRSGGDEGIVFKQPEGFAEFEGETHAEGLKGWSPPKP